MADKVLTRKGYVTGDFLAPSYRISGEVALRNQPLIDILNDKMSPAMRTENIYISPIEDPAVITGQFAVGQLRKENITLAVLPREEDGATRITLGHIQNNQPILFSLFATLPGFEVRGGLRLNSLVDIDNLLMQSVDRFITIYRATATVTHHPDLQFTGGAMVLNRELISLFSVEKASGTESIAHPRST